MLVTKGRSRGRSRSWCRPRHLEAVISIRFFRFEQTNPEDEECESKFCRKRRTDPEVYWDDSRRYTRRLVIIIIVIVDFYNPLVWLGHILYISGSQPFGLQVPVKDKFSSYCPGQNVLRYCVPAMYVLRTTRTWNWCRFCLNFS